MKWRVTGVIMLLLAIVLAGLILIPVPTSKSHTLLEADGLGPIAFVDEEYDFLGPMPYEKNVTINPLSQPTTADYVVNVFVVSYAYNVTPLSPLPIDLWIVNHTGRNMIWGYLNNETYPINATVPFYFPGVVTYCESIDKAVIVKPLLGLDYNGNYTVMLINPYDANANITIAIEDTLRTTIYLVQANVASELLTAIIALAGVYMVVKKPKKVNRIKRRKT